jgi:hypothetical protein
MADAKAFEGGCLCGAVRYRVDFGLDRVSHCHCSMCRRASGAAMVTWVTVPEKSFTTIKGEPRWFQSSDHGRRAFCAHCGTPILFASTRDPGSLDVTVGSLDTPELVTPKRHVYEPDRLPWLIMTDHLPRHGQDSNSPEL